MPHASEFGARIARSAKLLRILTGVLERHRGDPERCLQIAEVSGWIAWHCHAGTFTLPAIETLLQTHPSLAEVDRDSANDAKAVAGRTLHVLTEIYPVGGHTRLAKRWMDLMDEDAHAAVLVRQRQPFEATWLLPENRQIPLINLEEKKLTRRGKLARLITLFNAAHRVILHIHPDDACAVAAAYRAPEADIRFLNHADHVAWLGAGLPGVLLNLRQRGTRFAERRRGIQAASCDVVPLPITLPPRVDRNAARAHFGLSSQDTLVLTIASAYKFNAVGERSLLDPLDQFLGRPDVKLMVVGATVKHPLFARLAERHPGQILCMGNVPAPDLHRAAADIYLDSYPFASITSMLESAALGTPVVAYQPDHDELEILYSECAWLPEAQYSARDPEQLVNLLNALVDDVQWRRDLGLQSLDGMKMHHPESWRASMYAHLARTFPRQRCLDTHGQFEDGLMDRVLAGLMGDIRDHANLKGRLGLDRIGEIEMNFNRLFGRL